MLALLGPPMSSRPAPPSLIYRSPLAYRLLMAILYGRYYRARNRSVTALVPSGTDLLELCYGPGELYLGYLKAKGVRYRGLDLNPLFIQRLRRLGSTPKWRTLAGRPLPRAEIVLIQASLYHFLPDARPLIDVCATARHTVIISEPVRNLATSRLPLVACQRSERVAAPPSPRRPLHRSEPLRIDGRVWRRRVREPTHPRRPRDDLSPSRHSASHVLACPGQSCLQPPLSHRRRARADAEALSGGWTVGNGPFSGRVSSC